MTTDDFLRLHRKQIAIQHRRRLHQHFAERHDGDFNREPARLQNSSSNLFSPVAKVRVACVQLVPGVQNRNDRFVREFIGIQSELLVPGAMTEAAQGIGIEKAVAAEFFGLLSRALCGHMTNSLYIGGSSFEGFSPMRGGSPQ